MKASHTASTRAPAVAGMFYPREREALEHAVGTLLAQARAESGLAVPKAIIAPHAGYVYSGPIAASVYARLAPARARVRRVVLMGPAHRMPVEGLALPAADAFATPLGEVLLDREALAAVGVLPQVVRSAAAHAFEHSLEVQLPFLQTVLDTFTLVPFAVGYASAAQVAEVLETLWGGPETLIVISSDLSHYHPYRDAQSIDRRTADEILELRTDITHEQACGATPLIGLNLAARQHGMRSRLLDLRNSGDTAGDRMQVVGYGAFAYYEGRDDAC